MKIHIKENEKEDKLTSEEGRNQQAREYKTDKKLEKSHMMKIKHSMIEKTR